VPDPEVTGKVGRVIVRVRGGKGPGEIMVRLHGGSEAFIAYCPSEIERDTDVLVVSSRGERSVDVVPWPYGPESPEMPTSDSAMETGE
jgi:hypothetical protein